MGDRENVGDERLVLVRYGELTTKGGNRFEFEKALARNVRRAITPISAVKVERMRDRMLVRPERRVDRVAKRLTEVFGISSVSIARRCNSDLDSILGTARAELAETMETYAGPIPFRFRVDARRSDKRFPLPSNELAVRVADHVLDDYLDRFVVDLRNADVVLGVEVRDRDTFVFANRLRAAGGLPVGTLGRAVCLLSGGIDSPVAAWMTMKRGCAVTYASFHSAPYLGESSRQKIVRLVKKLARFQPRSRLASIPFTAIQEAIRDTAPEGYRTILYRRSMQRLAGQIAQRERAGALVTGESLGQVASQTMENLTCIGAASPLPLLRPLIAFDKQETIEIAKRIGTFDVSNLPEPDCCTVFMPRRPVIRGRLDRCEAAEATLPIAELEERALEDTEVLDVDG